MPFTKGSLTATSCMTAKSFVDTNVVLYTIGKDARKAEIARELVGAQPALSTQVVNESISVCLRKLSFTQDEGLRLWPHVDGSDRSVANGRGNA